MRKSFDLCKLCFCLQAQYCGVSELQAIKDDLGDDFYRSVGAFVNTFESCRQSVFCFQVKICVIDTLSDNICSFALVVEMICSTVTEKLDRELFTTSTLFTVFRTFRAGLNLTSRWPDTSDFHSPISALVPRPKFMTSSFSSPYNHRTSCSHRSPSSHTDLLYSFQPRQPLQP